MSILDRAKAHFAGLKPAIVDVPEWSEDGASPFPVTVAPLTVEDRRRVFKEGRSNFEASVDLVILKAKGPDGAAIFDAMDKIEVMRSVDADIILRIAGAALGGPRTVADTEKN
jgi:hypothetical protein